MGRKRIITQERYADAITRICNRDGASSLTFDALAQEIGASKSNVAYRLSTKAQMLQDYLEDVMGRFDDAFDTHQEARRPEANSALMAALDLARARHDQDEMGAVLAIAGAQSGSDGCRQILAQSLERRSGEVASEARNPALMLGVFASVIGLFFSESLGLLRLAEDERDRVLGALAELVRADALPNLPV